MSEAPITTVHVLISGRVQGIGFRWWCQMQAEARSLDGWVRNLRDGRVEALFQGPTVAVEAMIVACHEGPPGARVSEVRQLEAEAIPAGVFEIRPRADGPDNAS